MTGNDFEELLMTNEAMPDDRTSQGKVGKR